MIYKQLFCLIHECTTLKNVGTYGNINVILAVITVETELYLLMLFMFRPFQKR